MTTYVNQTGLGELFGLSFEEMDKILIEHGLKSGELATEKAVNEDYAKFHAEGPVFNYWNPVEVAGLLGLRVPIKFYVDEVTLNFQIATESFYSPTMERLILSQAFREIPEERCDEVFDAICKLELGDKREKCQKCGRTSPTDAMKEVKEYSRKYLCWRCNPNDAYIEKRLQLESLAMAASKPGLASIYTDTFKPEAGDEKLWTGAYSDGIDFMIGGLINPTIPLEDVDEFIGRNSYGQALLEFRFSGFEEFSEDRCHAFLEHAYKTIAKALEVI